MMYGNPIPNPTPSAAKAIVIFLSLMIVGAVVLTLAASGNFGPEAVARAKHIETQAEIEKEKELAALQYQKAEQQQKLEQAARDFELSLALKEWGTRVLVTGITIGLVLVAAILAAGKSAQWFYQARREYVTASAQAALSLSAQPAQPAASTEVVRKRDVYDLFSEIVSRLEKVEHRLAQGEIHGNGSDPSKIIPFRSAVGE